MDDDGYLAIPPYSLDKESKHALLSETLTALTRHHYRRCPEYRRILDAMQFDTTLAGSYYDLPFLPVRLFKEYDLLSIDRADVVKTMTSSGTSGQQVSRIFSTRSRPPIRPRPFRRSQPSISAETPAHANPGLRRRAQGPRNVFGQGGRAFSASSHVLLRPHLRARREHGPRRRGHRRFPEEARRRGHFAVRFHLHHLAAFLQEAPGKRIPARSFQRHDRPRWRLEELADQAVSPAAFKKALQDVCGVSVYTTITAWSSRPGLSIWNANAATCTPAFFPT